MKKPNNFKRKKHHVNLNVKRIKLSNSKDQHVHDTNGNSSQNIETKVDVQKENLQEARRQLPVYMVKGRFVSIYTYIISIKSRCFYL